MNHVPGRPLSDVPALIWPVRIRALGIGECVSAGGITVRRSEDHQRKYTVRIDGERAVEEFFGKGAFERCVQRVVELCDG